MLRSLGKPVSDTMIQKNSVFAEPFMLTCRPWFFSANNHDCGKALEKSKTNCTFPCKTKQNSNTYSFFLNAELTDNKVCYLPSSRILIGYVRYFFASFYV